MNLGRKMSVVMEAVELGGGGVKDVVQLREGKWQI